MVVARMIVSLRNIVPPLANVSLVELTESAKPPRPDIIRQRKQSNLQKFPQSPTIAIMPGDLVRVPETIF
jgi:hypothetical protein